MCKQNPSILLLDCATEIQYLRNFVEEIDEKTGMNIEGPSKDKI